ncbi:3276_t:CDS:1, partial [Gigaspora rosea]
HEARHETTSSDSLIQRSVMFVQDFVIKPKSSQKEIQISTTTS